MNNQERSDRKKVNLMTRETKVRLEALLADLNKKRSESLREIGEAAGPSSDWHDNFPFEQANRDYDFYSARVTDMEKVLFGSAVIEPRNEVGDVGIGNQVTVKFEDEDEPEKFTLLGEYDSGTRSDWISYSSLLGSNLIGRKVGETVEYEVGGKAKRLKIIEITKGEFLF